MGVSIEIGQLYFEKPRHFIVVPYMRVKALGEERWRCVSLGQTLHGSLKEVTQRMNPVDLHEVRLRRSGPEVIPAEMRKEVVVNLFKARGRL